MRWIGWTIGGGVIALIVAAVATVRSGDAALYPPPPGSPRVEVLVAANIYHSGIILPRAALAEGVLLKVLVGEGETVPLGTIIAVIGEPGEDISGLVSEASSGAAQEERKERIEGSPPTSPLIGSP